MNLVWGPDFPNISFRRSSGTVLHGAAATCIALSNRIDLRLLGAGRWRR